MSPNERAVRWAIKESNAEVASDIDYEKSRVDFTTVGEGYCETCYYETDGIELTIRYKSGGSKRVEFTHYKDLSTVFEEMSQIGQ